MKGTVFVVGDNVDTDVIIPARYLTTDDPEKLAPHALEDWEEDFEPGKYRFLVAGENFGCGSSREHAPVALDAAGIDIVFARSFARIYFRNAVNSGCTRPVQTTENIVGRVETGDTLDVDLEKDVVRIVNRDIKFDILPFQDEIEDIIHSGGLSQYNRSRT